MEEKRDFLGTITISLFMISTAVILILFVFHNYVSLIYKSIPFSPYIAYVILTSYFNVFSTVPLAYFQVTEQPRKFFLLTVGHFFLNISLILWFVVGLKRGAEGQLGAQLVGNLLLTLIYLFILTKLINFKFNRQILKHALAYSLPLIPAVLSGWVVNYTDRIFIERFFTLREVGIYSLGYQIALAVTIFAGGISRAYWPFFFRIANSEDQKEAKKTLNTTNTAYLLAVVLVVFLIAFFSKELVTILIDPKFLEAYKIIPLIAFGYLLSEAAGIQSLSIHQKRKTKALMYLGLFAAGINILLNFILVPRYGAYGAAYATIISFAVPLIVQYQYAKRCYFIPWAWKRILSYSVALFAVVALFFFVVNINIYVSIIIKILIAFPILYLFSKQYHIIDFRNIAANWRSEP